MLEIGKKMPKTQIQIEPTLTTSELATLIVSS